MGLEAQAATETSVMVEVAGKPLTRKATSESPARSKMAPAKAATHVATGKSAPNMSAT